MKHSGILTGLFIAFLLTACAAPVESTSTAAPPTAEPTADPMPVVEAFLSAHNEHDAAGAVSFMTDDAMFALPVKVKRHQEAQPVVGKTEIEAYLASDAWNAITIDGSEFQMEGDRVLFKCRILSNGQMIGSGSITSNSACVLVVRNNLITFVGDQAEALLYLEE